MYLSISDCNNLLRLRRVRLVRAQNRITKLAKTLLRLDIAKADNFHGNGALLSEVLHTLGLIHNDHELLSQKLRHLLAEQRTTSALRQLEVIVHLISSIDRDINRLNIVDILQRNAQALRLGVNSNGYSYLLSGLLRGGNAHNSRELSLLQALTNLVNGVAGRGARSETNHLLILNFVHSLNSSEFLKSLRVHSCSVIILRANLPPLVDSPQQ